MIVVQLPKLQQAHVLAKQPIQLNALLVGEADGYTSHTKLPLAEQTVLNTVCGNKHIARGSHSRCQAPPDEYSMTQERLTVSAHLAVYDVEVLITEVF